MIISELSKSSKIEENTAVYVVNGCWTGYIVRDCVTDDLILFIPAKNWSGLNPEIRKITWTFPQDSTYEDVFPSDEYNIRIHNTEEKEKRFSNLPFEVGAYAADEKSIYEIIGSSENESLVTTSPIELVKVKVKDLVTDEISVKNISELRIHEFNEEFNNDLIKLTKSSDLAVKAYLKATYLYSKDFKEMIDHAEGMLALDDDDTFVNLLKSIC